MALDGLKLGSFDVLKLAPSLSVKKEEDHRKDGNASMKGTGMVFNPVTLRWDGNENALANFDREVDPPLETPTPAQHRHGKGSFFPNTQPPQHPNKPDTGSRNEYSPTRGLGKPALIAPLSSHNAGNNIQVVGGMVFDPRQMRWLKMSRERQHSRGPSDNGVMSPSITDGEEDEDPFAGIEDLKDTPIGVSSPPTTVADMTAGGKSVPAVPSTLAEPGSVGALSEEFDVGPAFVQRQREEEAVWVKWCGAWFSSSSAASSAATAYDDVAGGAAWRYAIRSIASEMA
ncbi:hypothetical protein LTR28_011550 [Elasticomyces elasticus]|nr:hypothetical protein LTR28_011550 [Elasticomyces elasticus]